ncbi:MAG TPA: rRNA maturation RNase YbeY [Planctomycetota bacterium]|nr:rRNA maturation RNase YbeY [Planctomycetota bacterium]
MPAYTSARKTRLSNSPPVRRIDVASEQRRFPCDASRIAALATSVLDAEKRRGGLSVALVDDRAIARIHVDFLGVPGPTDVVSFPLEDEHDGLLGEVVVSTDTAAREARARGLSLEREVFLYIVHGILHLCGWDDHDPTERRRMHARQEELLEAFLKGGLSASKSGAGSSRPRRSTSSGGRSSSRTPEPRKTSSPLDRATISRRVRPRGASAQGERRSSKRKKRGTTDRR